MKLTPEIIIAAGGYAEMSPVDILLQMGMVSSKNEARRLIEQGAMKFNGQKVSNWLETLEVRPDTLIQLGKKRFGIIDKIVSK